jgi:hypothetical protein
MARIARAVDQFGAIVGCRRLPDSGRCRCPAARRHHQLAQILPVFSRSFLALHAHAIGVLHGLVLFLHRGVQFLRDIVDLHHAVAPAAGSTDDQRHHTDDQHFDRIAHLPSLLMEVDPVSAHSTIQLRRISPSIFFDDPTHPAAGARSAPAA